MSDGLPASQRQPASSALGSPPSHTRLAAVVRPAELLHEVFEAAATAHHGRVAVQSEMACFTYGELDARANRLAHYLRRRGVHRGDHVALLLPRGIDLYAAMLAILKAGAAYVPLDSQWPAERIAAVLADCRARLLVTVSDQPADLRAHVPCMALCLDTEATEIRSEPDTRLGRALTGVQSTDPCYAIFTSGSTGRPKGVSISHQSCVHFVDAEKDVFDVQPSDRVFQGFSIAFDASVEEIWLAFRSGAALVVGSASELRNGPQLPALLSRRGVTVLSTVPTLVSTFQDDVPSLRLLILGGEACPADLAARWARTGRRIVNTYGPTEATVVATYAELLPGRPVRIGRPLPGYSVLILDDQLREVPQGQAGELCIAGVGVALGYLGQPELTAQKFVRNPYAREINTHRLYRTGDLARLDADGELEFLGRADEQVKLRGFRVELGEIEAVLREHPCVLTVAVAVHRQGVVDTLVAHVSPREGRAFDEPSLRAHASQRLPSYMVPQVLQPIEQLPRLVSGKVDKKSLPPPRVVQAQISGGPDNQRERRLAQGWMRVLHRADIDCDANVFDLGAHSLLAAVLASELRREPGFEDLSVSDIYEFPSVRKLADALAARDASRSPALSAQAPVVAPVTSWRRRCFVLGQFAGLYPVFAYASLEWLGPYLVYRFMLERHVPTSVAVAWGLGSLIALYPMLLLVAWGAKWLLLGRIRPGVHRLWSFYHLRFWLAMRLLSAAPTQYLVGTPWMSVYLRLMGARIGRRAHLSTDSFAAFDLTQVGDDTSIDADVRLAGYEIEAGFLRIGTISVGSRCHVGARSTLAPNTRIDDGGCLAELSLLTEGAHVAAGEHWQGSPAARLPPSAAQTERALREPLPSSRLRAALHYPIYLLLALAVPAFHLPAMLPALLIITRVHDHVKGHLGLLCGSLLAAPAFVVSLALAIAAFKWLLLGRVKAGVYPIHGHFYLRKWFIDRLMELSLDLLGPVYATLYLNPWYRLLGARIGARAELSTAAGVSPDLLTLGQEAFVADAVSLAAPRHDLGRVTIQAVTLGARSFVGNCAVVAGGTELGAEALIGVLSVAPTVAEDARREAASWLGSPAFPLPRRERATGFDLEQTYQPPWHSYALRLFVEYFRITLPATGFAFLSCELLAILARIERGSGLGTVALLYPPLYFAFGIAAALLVVAAKWSLIGRYEPAEKPLWSGFVWRTELVTALHENLADGWLLWMVLGTPIVPWFFRLLGARIGAWTVMESTWLTEYDLIEIGDEVCLDADCTLQTHLFEDRVMKMSTIRLERRASVGADAVVLYDTRIEAGATLQALSLLMKGESLPAGTRWVGCPARRGTAVGGC
ncbi:MAG TPA: Pls/PosA family non-ribosomal peptide synthetase [Polyangiales bacterium]